MTRYIFLSHPQSPAAPRPAAIPAVRVESVFSMPGDNSNVFGLYISTHSGTHVDAPRHLLEHGTEIGSFLPSEFVFEQVGVLPVLLDDSELVRPEHVLPHVECLCGSSLLLFQSGWGKQRHTPRYSIKNPGFSAEGARCLIDHFPKLRAVGMDFLSMAANEFVEEGIEAHRLLFGCNKGHFLIFEDMDLSAPLTGLTRVTALPLLAEGADSAPCTILGEFDDRECDQLEDHE